MWSRFFQSRPSNEDNDSSGLEVGAGEGWGGGREGGEGPREEGGGVMRVDKGRGPTHPQTTCLDHFA